MGEWKERGGGERDRNYPSDSFIDRRNTPRQEKKSDATVMYRVFQNNYDHHMDVPRTPELFLSFCTNKLDFFFKFGTPCVENVVYY